VGAATLQTPSSRRGDALPGENEVVGSENEHRRIRKKLVRRSDHDNSQQIRLGVQALFLILNLWIGLQFYLLVRWAESGGLGPVASRPAGVEGWLPIEGMMQFKYTILTGQLPVLHPAAFFLFTAFVLSSLLFRKAFCSWLRPVGSVFRVLVEAGTGHLRPEFHSSEVAGLPASCLEVSAS